MAKQLVTSIDDDDPFRWDPDPQVLVSRRGYRFHVPGLVFQREPTEAEQAAWYKRDDQAKPEVRGDQWLSFQPGVTFLGTYSTSWEDVRHTHAGQVSAVPNMSKAVLVSPVSQMQGTLKATPALLDVATGRMLPRLMRDVFMRVVSHVKAQHPTLWRPVDAYDAPAMMLVPLGEVFRQNTEAGQQANRMILEAIPNLRFSLIETVTPIGMLHDYAIRSRAGGASAITAACKSAAARWKLQT